MAFWGIEVGPRSPYFCKLDPGVKLHISQATLGLGSYTSKSILIGGALGEREVFLCSLVAENKCSCKLNLELNSDDEVTFSVLGPQSIHLSGFLTK
ncbi:Peptidyl-prolyl cis-trans isomerase FKBP43 [Camellia lanceoleosa]|uniref:Peptidyl-prolyl cis-trans isomerase FKBP43 n=1 Tax=Camellia lanceoleosa TaxID=1840588 RepID=A0ACC0H7R3_9ERIC|nr:Peptidyl-prolyl cis-trans isomerase FKBP43 [Camellia lanceoleosa]